MPCLTFATAAKNHRLALGLSIRRFGLSYLYSAGNISKLERGLLPAPRGSRLHAYARALGLSEGSDEWREFFDLAAAARGEFPVDLRDEELLCQLPALFRTIRGDPPSDEHCASLIALLRQR